MRTISAIMLDTAKVKSLREKMGITQQEAAEGAGMTSKQQWNDIESGRRPNVSLDTLNKIAKALGVKAKDLLK